jgi:hypothetical protein
MWVKRPAANRIRTKRVMSSAAAIARCESQSSTTKRKGTIMCAAWRRPGFGRAGHVEEGVGADDGEHRHPDNRVARVYAVRLPNGH